MTMQSIQRALSGQGWYWKGQVVDLSLLSISQIDSDAKLYHPRACEILGRRMQLWHFGSFEYLMVGAEAGNKSD